jgi:hypothetical protein
MGKPTKEQVAWFEELHRELGLSVPDAGFIQLWFEQFPTLTKDEAKELLFLVRSREFRAVSEANLREKRRRVRHAELAERRAQAGNANAMNVMILTHAPTSSWYAATLMMRGHLVTMWGGGVISPFVAEEFEHYDGCLLLGTDPDLIEIADVFETLSKKVWRQLADIPRERDLPQAGS